MTGYAAQDLEHGISPIWRKFAPYLPSEQSQAPAEPGQMHDFWMKCVAGVIAAIEPEEASKEHYLLLF